MKKHFEGSLEYEFVHRNKNTRKWDKDLEGCVINGWMKWKKKGS